MGPGLSPPLRCFVLGFVCATRRPAPPLSCGCRCHPGRGAPATFPQPPRQAFENDYSFLDLCALLAQFSEHLQDVHAGSIAQSALFF
jgi:hypothetical protein